MCARKNKYESMVLIRGRASGVLTGDLHRVWFKRRKMHLMHQTKQMVMCGREGDPGDYPQQWKWSKMAEMTQFPKNKDLVHSFFHTGAGEGWHGWLKRGLKPGVVNLHTGCLESWEGPKLALISTLCLPPTLTPAPLWTAGCLKLVTAVMSQPLFRGQHTGFT